MRSQGRHNSAQRVPDFPVRHDSGALGLSAVSGHNPFCDLELEPLQTDRESLAVSSGLLPTGEQTGRHSK